MIAVMADTDIFVKIKEGNIQVFESVFKEYYQRLCDFARQYCNDMSTAEEVVQDVFYQIWNKKDKLNITTSFKAYIYKSVRNNCLQIIRKKNLNQKYIDYKKHTGNFVSRSPVDDLNAKELSKIINKALEALPERCRTIFEMSRVEGLKYQEIANELSISIKTVEANMGKALKHFRNNLKEYMEIICIVIGFLFI